MPPPIRVVRSLLPAFHAATSQRRGGLYSRWILIDLRRELIYRVLSSRRRPKLYPPFYQPNIRSSLDLFNQSSVVSPSVKPPILFLSPASSPASSPVPTAPSTTRPQASQPIHQSSVQSNPSLESLTYSTSPASSPSTHPPSSASSPSTDPTSPASTYSICPASSSASTYLPVQPQAAGFLPAEQWGYIQSFHAAMNQVKMETCGRCKERWFAMDLKGRSATPASYETSETRARF